MKVLGAQKRTVRMEDMGHHEESQQFSTFGKKKTVLN